VRRRRALFPSLLAGPLALLVVLVAIPLNVVSSYIPAAVTRHELFWIGLLTMALVAIVALTLLSGRSSAQDATPPCAGPVVVGEIPREPPAFVTRETMSRLAAAAVGGQVAVLCAVTGLRGVGKTQAAGRTNLDGMRVTLERIKAVTESAGPSR